MTGVFCKTKQKNSTADHAVLSPFLLPLPFTCVISIKFFMKTSNYWWKRKRNTTTTNKPKKNIASFCSSIHRISMETAGLPIPGYHYIAPNHIVKAPIHWTDITQTQTHTHPHPNNNNNKTYTYQFQWLNSIKIEFEQLAIKSTSQVASILSISWTRTIHTDARAHTDIAICGNSFVVRAI